jgi:molybdopterin-guanine dinucleotide biosynthesis protein A
MAVGGGAVAAAIVAGGPGSRLGGVAKPFLRVGGRSIAERQLEVLRPLFGRVLAIANDPARWVALGVEVARDRAAGAGPLGGIDAALAAIGADGGQGAVVCVAGDLPFLSPALLRELRDRAPEAAAVAPRRGERVEPLCARYAARLGPTVAARLAAGELAAHALLEAAGADWIDDATLGALDPDGLAFFNVNTPEDLARAELLAQRRAP